MNPKLLLCLAFVLSVGLFGCASAPPARATAISRAKPFIVALETYHRDNGDYPKQLNDLRPRYLASNVPLHDNRDPKHTWFLDYERFDRDRYKLYLDSSPCSQALFENGTFVAGVGPNYK